MPLDPILEKVVAFITRQSNGRTELLVFDHPTAGTQIPAGTVEAGEPIETAVVREALEETGFQAKIIRPLPPSTFDPLDDDILVALGLIRPRQAPVESAPPVRDGWYGDRGLPFRYTKPYHIENSFVHAVRREYDLNQEPPQLLDELSGWIPRNKVTNRQRRHYFELELRDHNVPQRWEHTGDHGAVWHLYWAPLEPRPSLIGRQNDWLNHVIDQLI